MNLRYLWRSLSLVFVLWFALSPALCYASETATSSAINYGVSTLELSDTEIGNGYLNANILISTLDSTGNIARVGMSSGYLPYIPPFSYAYMDTYNQNASLTWKSNARYAVFYELLCDTSSIVDKDDVFDITIDGLQLSYRNGYSWSIVNVGGGSSYYGELMDYSKIYSVAVQLFNKDLTQFKRYDVSDAIKVNGDTFSISLSDLQAPHDVYKIQFILFASSDAFSLDSSKTHSGFSGWSDFGSYGYEFVNSKLDINIEDSSKGLLSGIIDWLRSIRDGITGVKDGVTNVVKSITELPSKLWTAIENGLKGLFVPNEESITAMKDKWDTLLADRFGVVYQSGALVVDIANSIQEASTKDTITFPTVSYNFSGTDFTFGGYEVDVVPDRFEFLVDILKGVLDIVCTLAFIGAMRKKYDDLMMR